MKTMLKAIAISNIGNIRNNHEDNYLLGYGQYISKEKQAEMINSYFSSKHNFVGDNGIFAVCDGMGGHLAGEVASFETVKWLNNHYKALQYADENELVRHIAELNTLICKFSCNNIQCENMGTTLSAIIASNEQALLLNVGDSRIYCFIDNELIRKTIDHTEGQRLLNLNLLTHEEYLNFPSRKALYKYIGRKGDLVADLFREQIQSRIYYLICSDGISDIVSEQQMQKIFLENKDIVNI